MPNSKSETENKVSSVLDLIGEKEFRMLTLVGVFAALSMYLFKLSRDMNGDERIYIGFGAVSSLYLFLYLAITVISRIFSSGIKLWWKREVEDFLTFSAELILIVSLFAYMLSSFIFLAIFEFPLESTVYAIFFNHIIGILLFFKFVMPIRRKSISISALISLATIFLTSYLVVYNIPSKFLQIFTATTIVEPVIRGIGGAAIIALLATPFAYIYDKFKKS
ncbi:hypothetical protein Asulf_01508 [Archaeoglobus sulfaticallidus PM70-1]|uniref:Uncharacterized protein n=1 Tax=Archaeoglobus sulfaticallidus PM70-1 TaxID=387631 RepID=N0BLS6_9EURY|nr:hypothetical protein [Archaeoglobus sulfaticallidus]AGK61491.1 hypothetical protein Asulf_01508 [Archaeoglobus sulfaticallidus PM70-1]